MRSLTFGWESPFLRPVSGLSRQRTINLAQDVLRPWCKSRRHWLGSVGVLTRSRRGRQVTISPSGRLLAAHRGVAPLHHPAELLMVPFFSMKNAAGNKNHFVLELGHARDVSRTPRSRSPKSPGPPASRALPSHQTCNLDWGNVSTRVWPIIPEQLQLGRAHPRTRQGAVVPWPRCASAAVFVCVIVLCGCGVSEKRLERVDQIAAVGDAFHSARSGK